MKRLGMLSLVCVGMVHTVYSMDIQEDDSFGLPPAYESEYLGIAAYTPPATPPRASTPPNPPVEELPSYDSIVCPPLYTPASSHTASQTRARLPEYTPVAEIVLPAEYQPSRSFTDRVRRLFSRATSAVRPQQPVVVGFDPLTITAITESLVLFNNNYSLLMSQLNGLRNITDRATYQRQAESLRVAAELAQKIEDVRADIQAVQYLMQDLSSHPEHSQKLQQFGKLTVGQIAVILRREVQRDQETKKLVALHPQSVAELLRLVFAEPTLNLPTITPSSSVDNVFLDATIMGIFSDDMGPVMKALKRTSSSAYIDIQKTTSALLQGRPLVLDSSTQIFMQFYQATVQNPAGGRPNTQKFIDSFNGIVVSPTAYVDNKSKLLKQIGTKV